MNNRQLNSINLLVITNESLRFDLAFGVKDFAKEVNVEYLTNPVALQQFLQTENPQVDLCFILLELDWDTSLSVLSFQGFDVAVKLRVFGLRCGFHFISLFSKDKFFPARQTPIHPLLRIRAFHTFHQFPLAEDFGVQLVLRKMSDQLYDDMVSSLLRRRGLIREELHNLKNACIDHFDQLPKLTEIFDRHFESLKLLLQDKSTELAVIESSLWEAICKEQQKDQGNIINVIDQFSQSIIELSPPDQENHLGDNKLPLTRWKVLVVEDEANVRKSLADAFTRNRIQAVLVPTGEEALSFLEADRLNYITVLLSDIRLYEDVESEIWQELQGYDLIRKVYREFNHLLSFFVLTSARSRLLQLKKDFSFNVTAEYKRDVMGAPEAMNIFMRKIREKGDEVFFKSRTQPRGHGASAWEKKSTSFYRPLGHFYRDHLMSIDYAEAEEDINTMTEAYLADPSAFAHLSFRVELKPSPKTWEESMGMLNKFRNRILLGRRIALSYYIQGYLQEEIFRFMTQREGTKESQKFLFNSTLVLSFKNILANKAGEPKYFKSQLLEEELDYLKRHYHYKVRFDQVRINEADGNLLAAIFENLKSWVEQKPVPEEIKLKNDVEKMLKVNVEKMSIREYQQHFLLAQKVTQFYQLQHVFKEEINLDLDRFQNKDVKAFLATLVA